MQRHFADLVEEHRSSIGVAHLSLTRREGARVCPALMAEQFAFEQQARHGGAVDA